MRAVFVSVLRAILFPLFFAFIALGNIPRVFDFSQHENNLLASEALLYVISFFCLLTMRWKSRSLLTLLVFACGVFLSFCYGVILNGFDATALLYSLRLIALLSCAVVLGTLGVEKFHGNPTEFLSWMLNAYLVAALISCALYLCFPDAERLWFFLEVHHIKFLGDPHQHRFVSVYFDPNFYAAIACLPFLLSIFLFRQSSRMKYCVFACFFALTIFFTRSRSGIVLFLLLGAYMLWLYLKKGKVLKTKPSRIVFVFFLCVGSLGVLVAQGLFEQVAGRLISIPEDPSAGFRWMSFQRGIEQISEAPLLGIGYQFLYAKGLWVDASLLVVLACFGFCGFLGLFTFGGYYLYKMKAKFKQTNAEFFVFSFIMYIVLSVVFFSFFNQILFYPFWALPVIVLCSFTNLSIHKKFQETRTFYGKRNLPKS